jgi:hypothetical protein
MISRTNRKISNFQFPIFNSSQEGVTLFLAILVLSSILAISFSLATILFIEVRTSGDLTKTEGALAGANGVAEQALFNIKRSVTCDNTNTNKNCYTSNFTNHVVLNGDPQTTTIASPNLVDKVLPTSNSVANTENKYDFCSINTPPTNPDGTPNGCGYGKVTVTYEPSGNTDQMMVYLCQFDASGNTTYASPPCTDLSDSYWASGSCGTPVMTQNGGCPSQSWTLDLSKQQQLIIYNGNQVSTQDMFVQIQTYADIAGTIPKGLPYANKTAVSINAINGQVGRKLKVVIPNPAGSSAASSPSYHVNFQTSASPPPPAGYQIDDGSVFSVAKGYGWDASVQTRERDVNSDFLLDTFAFSSATATWNYTLPNGTYLVSLASGDPSFDQGPNRVVVEGVTVINDVNTTSNNFQTVTNQPITVSDGSLTVTIGGAAGNTILNYIDIVPGP